MPIQLARAKDEEQREIELECTLDKAQEFESVHEAAFLRLGETPSPKTPTGTLASTTSSRCRTTTTSATPVWA